MNKTPILLFCILAVSSVQVVHGRTLEINIDDEEPAEVDISVDGKIPGLCWACKWAMNKVKSVLTKNDTAEKIKVRLNDVCNKIGLLKKICRKFVKSHLEVLIEELTTSDDVRTICVNTKACKPKEVSHLFYSKSRLE